MMWPKVTNPWPHYYPLLLEWDYSANGHSLQTDCLKSTSIKGNITMTKDLLL